MHRRTLHRCVAAILTFSLIVIALPTTTYASELELDPSFAPDPIPDIWAQADGDIAGNGTNRSWIWGPEIHSAGHEPYADSPGGMRQVFYFDKARMEINNPDSAQDSIWYATSGLLIREMMLGRIQVGDHRSITTTPAEIPVTGDMSGNDDSPTYAALGQHRDRTDDRTGQPVTEKLHANGDIEHGFTGPDEVVYVRYDETLGHNVPDVFWDWMNDQPIGWQYIVGHPLTEAFWVDTVVGGASKVVLVQAFERRILTYTPGNPAGWEVEAGNAGLHYRTWRDLRMPEDPAYHAIAYEIPYGEIIANAAERNDLDVYLLAGVAQAASQFDPLADLAPDRLGLMGAPAQLFEQHKIEHPHDPTINVAIAADILAMLSNINGSSESAVRDYFAWQDAVGTFSTLDAQVADQALDAAASMRDRFDGSPSPFTGEVGEPRTPEPPTQPAPPDLPDAEESDLYFVGSGEAAHYGKEAFPVERMEEIMRLHARWGGAIDGWEYDPNGYYCVHPNYIVGERLHLTAPNGETFWCTIADYVADEHVDYWWSKWAIEVNWDLFEAMGIPYQQTIEVRAPR